MLPPQPDPRAPAAGRARASLPALALGVALALAALPGSAAEEEPETPEVSVPTIYKWVDTNGIAHYTTQLERIPLGLRREARRLRAGRGSDAPRVAAPATASPYAATAGRGASEAERWAASDRPRTYGGEEGWSAEFDEGEADGGAPGAPPGPSRADVEAQIRDLDGRIASVEADIAADEEILKRFVAAPAPQDTGEIAYDASFREVAERLPALLAELESLRDERDDLGAPDGR